MQSDYKKFSCKYPSCINVYMPGNINKHFFKFPALDSFSLKWKQICQIPQNTKTSNFRLCEDHFSESEFFSSQRKRLKYGAMPTQPESKPYDEPNTLPTLPVHEENNNTLEPVNSELNIDEDFEFLTQDGDKEKEPDILKDQIINNDNITTGCNIKKETGILSCLGTSRKDLSPREELMYKIHRRTMCKISKLKLRLKNDHHKIKTLKELAENGKFQFLEEKLNEVTKHFINSQLRNCNRVAQAKRWTTEDKTFALSMYKRSPRLYRFLLKFFQLPSVTTLKALLSKIPFETGLNEAIMNQLGIQVDKMQELDRHCVLLFDEMSLSSGLHYEQHKSVISGYVDMGHLGRTNQLADHALVFMVRGIRKSWKQVVAYYFSCNTISTLNLKQIIMEVIQQLQQIGLKVVGTVCDQGSTNRAALNELLKKDNKADINPFFFECNGEPICIIYDVPHLLKNTRNSLLRCKLEYSTGKQADFEHIAKAFQLDHETRSFKMLPKLKKDYFEFKDSRLKMKVKVAAAQLSFSVAGAIETFISSRNLPSEAAYTAEFVHQIDCMFDSLNGYSFLTPEGRPFRGVLKAGSPHMEFWSNKLREMQNWKLIDKKTNRDITRQYKYIKGWQTTIRSIIYLWNRLEKIGFNYFNLRNFNQDPLENLFSIIRQHGVGNTNPTCHQFTAALKTAVVNGLTSPINNGNCEIDTSENLNNLAYFFQKSSVISGNTSVDDKPDTDDVPDISEQIDYDDLIEEPSKSYAGAYVAGYILKQIKRTDCELCEQDLFSKEPLNNHSFISFKEYCSDKTKLQYPTEKVTTFVDDIHNKIFSFLDSHGHLKNIHKSFKESYCNYFSKYIFCEEHNLKEEIFDRTVRLVIFKYIKDRKESNKENERKKHKK